MTEPDTRIGGDVVELRISNDADRGGQSERVGALLRDLGSAEPILDHEAHAIWLPVDGGPSILDEVVRRLDGAGIAFDRLTLHRPTLDAIVPGADDRPGRPIRRLGPRPGGTPT